MNESLIIILRSGKRVKVSTLDIQRFWARVDKSGGCWIYKGRSDPGAYGHFKINNKNLLTHRLSWAIHRGSIPKGIFVCHDCPGGDNKRCVNPDHLWLGTRQDNIADAIQKGQTATGDRNGSRVHPEAILRGGAHPRSKLTDELVVEMRRLHAGGGVTYKELGIKFGVCAPMAWEIVKRKNWLHI